MLNIETVSRSGDLLKIIVSGEGDLADFIEGSVAAHLQSTFKESKKWDIRLRILMDTSSVRLTQKARDSTQ